MDVKTAQAKRGTKTARKSAVVLVVEASDGDWRHHMGQLSAAGFIAETVRFGAQAAKRLKEGGFDLMVLDGSAAASEARNLLAGIRKTHGFADLPVIMVAPSAESADIVRVFESGANDCVAPPVDLPVLTARIRAQLAIRNGNRPAMDRGGATRGSVDWLQLIMDNVAIAIFETRADGSITRMNTAAGYLTGRDSEQLVGQRFGSIFVDESDHEISSLLAQAATDGYFVNNHPARLRDESGRERVFSLSLRRIDDSHAAGVVVTAEDVTETWQRQDATPTAGDKEPGPSCASPAESREKQASGRNLPDVAARGDDNRSNIRRRVFKGAKLTFNNDNSLMDCVVRDISDNGARLVFETYFDCPREVRLRISDGRAYDCEVRWFHNKIMGVSFLAPAEQ